MKVTITIEDETIKVSQGKPKIGAVKKKRRGKAGAVKKISINEKKKKGTRVADEEQEMEKTLKGLGVEPKSKV